MPENIEQMSFADFATPTVRGPVTALLLYSIYGMGFGIILVVIGAFTSFLVLGIGGAHVVFGLFAVVQYCKSQPPTRTKHVALVATNAIVLGWGIAVAINAGGDGALVALILGAIYVPLPVVCIGMLVFRRARRFYWEGSQGQRVLNRCTSEDGKGVRTIVQRADRG
jgi:hypothetical protein